MRPEDHGHVLLLGTLRRVSQSARSDAARWPERTMNVVAECGILEQRCAVNYAFSEKSADCERVEFSQQLGAWFV